MLDLAVLVELRDQAGLAAVVRSSDVRTILAGHLHYSTTATFAGIPVSVASATCYTQDLNVPVGGTRGRDGAQAFNLVHVYDTRWSTRWFRWAARPPWGIRHAAKRRRAAWRLPASSIPEKAKPGSCQGRTPVPRRRAGDSRRIAMPAV